MTATIGQRRKLASDLRPGDRFTIGRHVLTARSVSYRRGVTTKVTVDTGHARIVFGPNDIVRPA